MQRDSITNPAGTCPRQDSNSMVLDSNTLVLSTPALSVHASPRRPGQTVTLPGASAEKAQSAAFQLSPPREVKNRTLRLAPQDPELWPLHQVMSLLTHDSSASPPWPTPPSSQQSLRAGKRLSQCLGRVITRPGHRPFPEPGVTEPPPSPCSAQTPNQAFQGYQSMASSPCLGQGGQE